MVNRSVQWAAWDEELLGLELAKYLQFYMCLGPNLNLLNKKRKGRVTSPFTMDS